VLAPNGYVLNGVVEWDGEGRGDFGEITVVDNRVFTSENSGEVLPSNNVRTDVVLILEGMLNERLIE
jgi:hypothetical protein